MYQTSVQCRFSLRLYYNYNYKILNLILHCWKPKNVHWTWSIQRGIVTLYNSKLNHLQDEKVTVFHFSQYFFLFVENHTTYSIFHFR